MPAKLAQHGSEAGYRAELKRNDVCNRCRNGHRVFDTQYNKANKAKGIKYDRYDVLDHLYKPGQRQRMPAPAQMSQVTTAASTGQDRARPHTDDTPEPDQTSGTSEHTDAPGGSPSLGDRLGAALGKMAGREYVEESEYPSHLHAIEPDAEPSGDEWTEVKTSDFVLNEAAVNQIQENLELYLSVVGMSVEIIDPYCGAIAADNLDNMVKKWTKVITHYPKAAEFFMDAKGGILMAWISAIQATWPVLLAIYRHHLARTVQTDGGRVFFKSPNGQRVDATMPPMPDTYAYSAA